MYSSVHLGPLSNQTGLKVQVCSADMMMRLSNITLSQDFTFHNQAIGLPDVKKDYNYTTKYGYHIPNLKPLHSVIAYSAHYVIISHSHMAKILELLYQFVLGTMYVTSP